MGTQHNVIVVVVAERPRVSVVTVFVKGSAKFSLAGVVVVILVIIIMSAVTGFFARDEGVDVIISILR